MASQDANPTATSAAGAHPAVTPSQASNAQSAAPTASAPAAGGSGPGSNATSSPSAATASEQQQQSQPSQGQIQVPGQVPALPPLPAPEGNEDATTVEVNGARVSLVDKLGPTVVNADGTISRIANWPEMTEIERRNTLRVLGARNKLRLDALREAQNQNQSQGQNQGGNEAGAS